VECMSGIGDKKPILHDSHCTIHRWNHPDSTASQQKTQVPHNCILGQMFLDTPIEIGH
jgi:hypothetical protein